jgi:hypothetical protein
MTIAGVLGLGATGGPIARHMIRAGPSDVLRLLRAKGNTSDL